MIHVRKVSPSCWDGWLSAIQQEPGAFINTGADPRSPKKPNLWGQKKLAHRQIIVRYGELAYGNYPGNSKIIQNTLKNLLLWLCKGDCLQFLSRD